MKKAYKLYSFTTKAEADNFIIKHNQTKGLLCWNGYFNCWLFMQGTMDYLACVKPNGEIIEHYFPTEEMGDTEQ